MERQAFPQITSRNWLGFPRLPESRVPRLMGTVVSC
ncbi:hypothetical protein E2C01_073142 [Portunus trituberculatus]|uniref:Uncharacterized protein n=1 Tax=Portunus trituberculatus TaxID=210409 RepID=A0A5B7ICJ3_PORTR|nr:hypothetical protein [Portunus trituberculatus]